MPELKNSGLPNFNSIGHHKASEYQMRELDPKL
jgi:hypothetical protein